MREVVKRTTLQEKPEQKTIDDPKKPLEFDRIGKEAETAEKKTRAKAMERAKAEAKIRDIDAVRYKIECHMDTARRPEVGTMIFVNAKDAEVILNALSMHIATIKVLVLNEGLEDE